MDKTPEEIAKRAFEKQRLEATKNKQEVTDKLFRKLQGQLRKVTPELFAKFLDERGASRTCLSCGSNKLSVPEASTIDETKLPKDMTDLTNEELVDVQIAAMTQYVNYSFIEEERMPRLSNVQYRVNCLNCGFVSHYRAYPVVQWVLDQEGADKDE